MHRTNIYLDERQTAALDRLSQTRNLSRAELVRQFVDRGLTADSTDLDADLDAIESSFGVLADADWPRRGEGEREAHLERIRNL